jgi:hypothetical protein
VVAGEGIVNAYAQGRHRRGVQCCCVSSGARARDGLTSHSLASGFDKSDTEIVASAMLAERRCCVSDLLQPPVANPGTQSPRTSMSKGATATLSPHERGRNRRVGGHALPMERENACLETESFVWLAADGGAGPKWIRFKLRPDRVAVRDQGVIRCNLT